MAAKESFIKHLDKFMKFTKETVEMVMPLERLRSYMIVLKLLKDCPED